jgi:hypothetical protein
MRALGITDNYPN